MIYHYDMIDLGLTAQDILGLYSYEEKDNHNNSCFPTGINSTLGRKLQITLLSVSNTWFILLQLFTTYDALICKSVKICVVSFYYNVNENICFHKPEF